MKQKQSLVVLMLILLVSGLITPALARKSPKITSTMGSVSIDGFSIIVKTRYAEGKWVGCSIRNRKTGRIVRNLDAHRLTNTGQKTWIVEDLGSGKGYEYIVNLWETKVLRRDCRRTDPSDGRRPCQYCRAEGYHMEPFGDPLDSSGWKRILGGW